MGFWKASLVVALLNNDLTARSTVHDVHGSTPEEYTLYSQASGANVALLLVMMFSLGRPIGMPTGSKHPTHRDAYRVETSVSKCS